MTPGRRSPLVNPPTWTLAVPAALFAGMLVVGALVGPTASTETRYFAMAREMLVSGDWVVPSFNGAPLLEKPPFEYWGTAAAMAVLGVNDVAPRVPHLLAGALVLVVVAAMVTRLARPDPLAAGRGRLAALALGTTIPFVVQAYVVAPDVWLVLFTTLAGWALLEVDRAPGRAPRGWTLLLHAAIGLGIVVKGPLAFALVFGAAAATALVRRDARILRPFASPLGLALLAAIAVPWYVALNQRIPGILGDLVERRLFGGMASSADFHGRPVWVVWLPLLGAFPWLGMLPGAIGALRRSGRWRSGPGLPAALLALSAPLLFTFSASRLASYPAPAYPWIAAIVALGAGARGRDGAALRGRWMRVRLGRATIGMGAAACLVAVVTIAAIAPPPLVAGALVATAACALAVALLPTPRRLYVAPVPRAALATALFLATGALAVVVEPRVVKNAKGVWTALERERRPGEPFAVSLNYEGDWGLLPWYSRSEVLFFGYPSKSMMFAAESRRLDLFQPRERLVAWLKEPGRRYLMVRPRDRKRLVEQGVVLETVATVHEYELVATPR